MRKILAVAAVAAISLIGASFAGAQDTGALPHDEPSLRALDNAQLRIVRRAMSQCVHFGEAQFGASRSARARACLIPLADRAVASAEDPALQAYHQWLPFGIRYDENRPGTYWQRLVPQ